MLRTIFIPIFISLLLMQFSGQAFGQDFNGTIGIYGDPDATCRFDHNECVCCAEAPASSTTTLYILALPGFSTMGTGITGAEFRVTGQPTSGLILTARANPAASIVLGNPFSDESKPLGSRGGVNIAWAECQIWGSRGILLLFTVTVINTGDVTDIFLATGGRDPANNPNFPCPLVTACDGPVFTALCVSGSRLHLNPRTTAVQSRPWDEVKGLYR